MLLPLSYVIIMSVIRYSMTDSYVIWNLCMFQTDIIAMSTRNNKKRSTPSISPWSSDDYTYTTTTSTDGNTGYKRIMLAVASLHSNTSSARASTSPILSSSVNQWRDHLYNTCISSFTLAVIDIIIDYMRPQYLACITVAASGVPPMLYLVNVSTSATTTSLVAATGAGLGEHAHAYTHTRVQVEVAGVDGHLQWLLPAYLRLRLINHKQLEQIRGQAIEYEHDCYGGGEALRLTHCVAHIGTQFGTSFQLSTQAFIATEDNTITAPEHDINVSGICSNTSLRLGYRYDLPTQDEMHYYPWNDSTNIHHIRVVNLYSPDYDHDNVRVHPMASYHRIRPPLPRFRDYTHIILPSRYVPSNIIRVRGTVGADESQNHYDDAHTCENGNSASQAYDCILVIGIDRVYTNGYAEDDCDKKDMMEAFVLCPTVMAHIPTDDDHDIKLQRSHRYASTNGRTSLLSYVCTPLLKWPQFLSHTRPHAYGSAPSDHTHEYGIQSLSISDDELILLINHTNGAATDVCTRFYRLSLAQLEHGIWHLWHHIPSRVISSSLLPPLQTILTSLDLS